MTNRAEELAALLGLYHPRGQRDVYRSADYVSWYVTNGNTLPSYDAFDESVVIRLSKLGIIERTHPKYKDSYRLTRDAMAKRDALS